MDDPLTNAEAKQPLNRRQRLGGVLEVIVLVASLALAVFNATRHDWVQLTLSLMVGLRCGMHALRTSSAATQLIRGPRWIRCVVMDTRNLFHIRSQVQPRSRQTDGRRIVTRRGNSQLSIATYR